MSDILNTLNQSQKDFENSGFKDWDDYIHNMKKEQAYEMLGSLGYYWPCGREGWVLKSPDVSNNSKTKDKTND